MKLYTVDCGWRGGIAILAESREEALKLLGEDNQWYITAEDFDETELTESKVVLTCTGDQE